MAVIHDNASFPIDGGATATLYAHVQDGRQLSDHDLNGIPLRIDGVNVASPYNGQFAQLDVVVGP